MYRHGVRQERILGYREIHRPITHPNEFPLHSPTKGTSAFGMKWVPDISRRPAEPHRMRTPESLVFEGFNLIEPVLYKSDPIP
jgi:hypothetical protein